LPTMWELELWVVKPPPTRMYVPGLKVNVAFPTWIPPQ